MLALTEVWCNRCATPVGDVWYRVEITAEATNGRSLGFEYLLCVACAQKTIEA